MPKFKPDKLRVNLKLVINRLKLLEKKKTEQAMKARKEIADYIKSGRIERARIRVEHIIREDYLVEAMEVIELYCDLLLARFGMLEAMSYCEDSLSEPISTLIWVAPRLCAEVQELSVVADQMAAKFGKPFAEQAKANMSGTVNPKVIHRLGIEAPKKSLVENYLIEIARNYRVEYEPDPTALMDEDILPPEPLPNDDKPFYGGGGGGGEAGYVPPFPPQENPYTADPAPPPAAPIPAKQLPSEAAPPYSEQAPDSHTSLPYPPPPAASNLPYPNNPPSTGVQPPPLPSAPVAGGLDLPPVPTTGFPSASTSSDTGGDVDFDDLTRRFEELKRRR